MDFRYLAREQTGAVSRGTVEAGSEEAALKLLRERGLVVSVLHAAGTHAGGLAIFSGISLRDRMLLAQELGVMLRAGIPLARALTDLEDQTSSRALRAVLRKVAVDLRGGTQFSDALRKHPAAFPPLMIAMIRSGEASGKLVEVLERLSEQMEKDAELRSKLISALIYPAILTIGIVGVMILVVLFVVPQLNRIFLDVGVPLPLLTRILLGITDALRHYGLIILGLGVVALIAAVFILRQPGPRLWFDTWKLRAPLFGPLAQKIALARFATTGSTLLAAGVPLLDALRISREVVANRHYETEISRIARAAETGRPLAETIRSGRVLPPMVGNLVAVGEESGSLDASFTTIATFYDREVEATTRNLTVIIEPVLMIMMGVTIGLLVAAVLMPIYKLVQAL